MSQTYHEILTKDATFIAIIVGDWGLRESGEWMDEWMYRCIDGSMDREGVCPSYVQFRTS